MLDFLFCLSYYHFVINNYWIFGKCVFALPTPTTRPCANAIGTDLSTRDKARVHLLGSPYSVTGLASSGS